MPEVATGIMSQPEAVKAMLLASSTWQSWGGADYEMRVHVGGAESEEVTRPFAEVEISDHEINHFTGHASGNVRVWIEDDVIDAYTNEAIFANADAWFRNRVGPLMSDLIALSRGPNGHLAINGAIQVAGPWRTDEDQRTAENDFYAVELTIPFGV